LEVEVRDGLLRTRRTDAQVTLGSDQRLANVAGAFAVRPEIEFIGLSVVLVDDVITTGSTLSACVEALYNGGASTVKAATVAREM
jgi:predicted amidophosphoribosyltransferase